MVPTGMIVPSISLQGGQSLHCFGASPDKDNAPPAINAPAAKSPNGSGPSIKARPIPSPNEIAPESASSPNGSTYRTGFANAYRYVFGPPMRPTGSLVRYLPVLGS